MISFKIIINIDKPIPKNKEILARIPNPFSRFLSTDNAKLAAATIITPSNNSWLYISNSLITLPKEIDHIFNPDTTKYKRTCNNIN
jgi:hypothetical protein